MTPTRRVAWGLGHLLIMAFWVGTACALPDHQYQVAKPGFDADNMALKTGDSISAYNGALQLTYTDVHLPGKIGRAHV